MAIENSTEHGPLSTCETISLAEQTSISVDEIIMYATQAANRFGREHGKKISFDAENPGAYGLRFTFEYLSPEAGEVAETEPVKEVKENPGRPGGASGPDYNELKDKARMMGLEFPGNISKADLIALIDENTDKE